MPPSLPQVSFGRTAMDRDLLYEVLRVYLEGEEMKAEFARTGLSLGLGTMEEASSSAMRRDRCWMQDALSPDAPYFGFDKVVQKLQEPLKKPPLMPLQSNKRKCWSCNAKLGLTPASCKCGYTFCGSHRYPETHRCAFDFKRENKRKLELLNPALRPDKLVRVLLRPTTSSWMQGAQERSMAKLSERALRRKQLRESKKKATRIPPIKETLRKLYLRTHPDLFGQFPKEQHTNTESYKELMGILDAIANIRGEFPPAKTLSLPFYLTTGTAGQFKNVTLNLKTTGGACSTLMETQLGKFFEECGWEPLFEWNKGSWGLTTTAVLPPDDTYERDEAVPQRAPQPEVAPAFREQPKASQPDESKMEVLLRELNDVLEVIAAVPYFAHEEEGDYKDIYELYTNEDENSVNGLKEIERRGGYNIIPSTHMIWEGERDAAVLIQGLDMDSALIVQ
ncbi:hypothetical protein DYB30_010098, partial [Aphanomyces astaci]